MSAATPGPCGMGLLLPLTQRSLGRHVSLLAASSCDEEEVLGLRSLPSVLAGMEGLLPLP